MPNADFIDSDPHPPPGHLSSEERALLVSGQRRVKINTLGFHHLLGISIIATHFTRNQKLTCSKLGRMKKKRKRREVSEKKLHFVWQAQSAAGKTSADDPRIESLAPPSQYSMQISHFQGSKALLNHQNNTTPIEVGILSVLGMLPPARFSRGLFRRNSYIAISTYIGHHSLLPSRPFAERRFTTSSPTKDGEEPKTQPLSKVGDPDNTHTVHLLSDEQDRSLKAFENACKRL